MSLGSGFLENIPHFTFTPTEHQVECVRVASTKNLTFVLNRPQEKSFLVLMMVREAANSIRSGAGKAVILLHKPQQVTLWASFLTRMTDLSVSGLTEELPIDTGQLVAGGVLVTTHQTFSTLLARKHIDLTSCRLLLVDNCQVGLNASSALYTQYKLLPRNMAPRLVTTTPNILVANASSDSAKDGLAALPRQFGRLESLLPSHVECACEVTSQLRYLARPRELLVLHAPGEGVEKIEEDIRKVLEDLKQFLEDHEYSLWNTYGDGFADLIADIPDPVVCPLSIIEDFLGILTELGVWCADRAALILMIKIDKLKTREKYERHFLLLSVLFTTMIKIRKMCDDAYGDLSEREKLERFSRPKLIRLVELLEIYTPAELSKTAIDESKTESVVSEVVDNELLSDESKNNAKDEEATKDKSTNLDSTEINECDSEKDLISSNPKDSSVNSVPESKNPSMRPARRGGGGRRQPAQEDPDALCALIVVDTTFTAKILYHFLKDLSRCRPDLSFLCPQYAVSDNKEPDPRDSENERKKQEEALRRFRMRECNVLVSSSILEEGIDFVKCNLVIAFDPPKTFHRYVYSKVKVKSAGGSLVQLCQTESRAQQLTRLGGYRRLEMCLLNHCTNRAAPAEEDRDADRQVALLEGYPPKPTDDDTPYTPPLTLNTSILTLNRYCAKLPSDTFTRLTPSWTVERCSDGHFCALFLPINSPLKDLVIGRAMPTAALARRAASYEACVRLNKIGELDDNMMPIGKESLVPPMDWGDGVRPGTTKRRQYYYKRVASCLTVTDFTGGDDKEEDDVVHDEVEALVEKVDSDMKISTDEMENHDEDNETSDNQVEEDSNELDDTDDDKLKARYAKLKVPEEAQYNLYALQMRLSCPIPDEQNTRGRKIHDPADASQKIGLLLPRNMPTIPVFPIYTRSGEVLVSVELVLEGLVLSQDQLRKIFTFHIFTFSSVLRLEKYPMVFHAENSQNCVIVVPLKRVSSGEEVKIDWEFVDIIQEIAVKKLNAVPEEERVNFEFEKEEYSDAVIMPWYRNQDQPQYFYVAEICHHLSPASDFPGQGFDTFEKYYSTKYGIKIQNRDQPLLDVDHTSARLNFLTPRYVNRKGIALPTSSEETKRNKRENLDQKQILVPELCTIHPFPASLWRQTVSLPCTLYRLNGLLIADQIRRVVSLEMRMGLPEVGVEFKWPALNFGWTLADVFVGGGEGVEGVKHVVRKKEVEKVGGVKENVEIVDEIGNGEFEEEIMVNGEWDTDLGSLSDKLLNKLGEEEKRAKKKKLEIGMWTNDMAAQDGGKDWGAEEEMEDTDIDDYADLAGVELPDNLTFIGTGLGENWGTGVNRKGEVIEEKGGKDWGTGIQMRNFRVGSPTFFSGSGRNNMAGLMDDLEGFSCSDSEDEWTDGEDEQLGSRIEFHGENVAETIDDTEECQAREERVARDRDQEATMVQDNEWNPMDLIDEEEENGVDEEIDAGVEVVPEDQPSSIRKPGEATKVVGRTIEDGECKFEPYCPVEKSEVHLDTVLGRLALAPSLVKSQLSEETPGVILWPGIDQDQPYRFDHQPDLANTHGPDPSLVLQALTMSNSNDAINLERLETIGDSFLKYAITSYLFCQHSHIHEGKLSHLRSKQVSNLNLYKLGRSRGLGECMIASKFEPHDNWLPPSYHVPRELEQALIESGVPASHWNMADLPGIDSMTSAEICKLIREKSEALRKDSDKDIEDLPSFIPYNLLTQHSIPDKSIADCVEALIGAYLISCGPRGALLFMSWLGLKVLPNDSDNCPGILEPPPSPLLKTPGISNPEGQLMYLLDGYSKFEHMIGYVWRDKSYLLQAFSHASYYPNRLTDCYQRLEFLGDAVLDYLITRHLYQDERLHSPGALTDLRSALVNNTIFACLAVRHQFHKFFKHLSPGLQVVCDRFVRIQAENDWKVSEECYLIEEEESEEAEDIEVPKALGDIFESVAGSIFLDSGLSLDAVWKVYYRMMKDEIQQFSSHVPKSPIRELLELEPETAKFGKPEKLADGRRVRVSVEVFGKGSFKGIGRNYRIAKCTAAKCALKALRKMDHKKKQK